MGEFEVSAASERSGPSRLRQYFDAIGVRACGKTPLLVRQLGFVESLLELVLGWSEQLDRRSCRQDGVRNRLGRRWTARNPNVDGKHGIERPDDLGDGAEDSATQSAIA